MTKRDEATRIEGSLRMREPGDLQRQWIIETGQQRCGITLATRRVEAANGWAIDDPSSCLAGLVPGATVWRPAPEGVEFAGSDRLTLIVFTATGETPLGTATLPDGRVLTLRPG